MAYTWQTWLADALRAEGCTVVEEGDWKHRGRPSSTGSFNPYGVLMHHTGATASTSNPFPSKSTLINGRSDLPGPLCHVGVGYDGVCHVIAAGRANHGGDCRGSGPIPSGDANAMLIGVEIDYNGTQPISAAQKDAATRVAAACIKRFKRNSDYVRIHAETSTTGKWDTGGVSGSTWRSLVTTQIQTGGDDVPLTQGEIDSIANAVWARQFTSSWSAKPSTASGLLVQANYYAITGGMIGDNPEGNNYEGQPTAVKVVHDAVLAVPSGGTAPSGDGAHSHAGGVSSTRGGLASVLAQWPLILLLLVIAGLLIAVIARQ